MSTIRQLNQELATSKSLLLITESLGEVAAIKFKTTHNQIEHNTAFFQEIAQVYKAIQLVKAKRHRLSKEPIKDYKDSSRTVSLLLTSNYQFYGDLDKQLTNYFMINTAKYPTDRIVVGTTGIGTLEALRFSQKYDKVVFNSDSPKSQELAALVAKIRPYGRVLVYHSKFVTVLDQQVDIAELSTEEAGSISQIQEIDYILEPELDKMLEFFENQIMASRLDALFLQSQLARTAARMVGMDQAQMNAEKQIAKEKGEIGKQRKKIQNLRILETYTGIKASKKGRH